jgi:hypothetical protein
MSTKAYIIKRDSDANVYNIVETFTQQIVAIEKKFVDADKRLKFFLRGGGYDGNTPPFILQKLFKSKEQEV